MSKTICPGQDTRYWRPGDIFDVRCGNCGKQIEFFKDEASRRCPDCGNRVQNPKLSMGCAQWCEHAKECLGFDPKAVGIADDSAGYDVSLADRLGDAIKLEVGGDSDIYKNAELALDRAKELIDRDNGNPRVIIAATLLLEIDIPSSGKKKRNPISGNVSDNNKLPMARRIMKEVELDSSSIDDVCEIIEGYQNGKEIDSQEFRIVSDSHKIVESDNV